MPEVALRFIIFFSYAGTIEDEERHKSSYSDVQSYYQLSIAKWIIAHLSYVIASVDVGIAWCTSACINV